jgi:hypothetical protein
VLDHPLTEHGRDRNAAGARAGPAQAEEPPVAQMPKSVEVVQTMSWADIQAVFLSFSNEIAAVSERGADALHERLDALPYEQRLLLAEPWLPDATAPPPRHRSDEWGLYAGPSDVLRASTRQYAPVQDSFKRC